MRERECVGLLEGSWAVGPFRCTPAKSAIDVVAFCNRRLWPHRLFDTSDVVSATIYVLICRFFFRVSITSSPRLVLQLVLLMVAFARSLLSFISHNTRCSDTVSQPHIALCKKRTKTRRANKDVVDTLALAPCKKRV